MLRGTRTGLFPPVPVSGVTLSESNSFDNPCMNSTLSFNGDLTALTLLNGATLTCHAPVDPSEDTVTLVVPGNVVHVKEVLNYSQKSLFQNFQDLLT